MEVIDYIFSFQVISVPLFSNMISNILLNLVNGLNDYQEDHSILMFFKDSVSTLQLCSSDTKISNQITVTIVWLTGVIELQLSSVFPISKLDMMLLFVLSC